MKDPGTVRMYRVLLVAWLLTPCLAGSGLAQTPTWGLQLLGTPQPEWTLSAVAAVNDDGLTVGNSYLSGWKRAWVTGPEQALELLPLPAGANWSEALDVNQSGIVVGSVLFDGSVSQAVIWSPAPSGYEAFLVPIGPGGHLPFDARGISDAGDVVGKYGIFGGSYHWSAATGVTQIPTSIFPEVPYDINERRQILGGSYRMDLDTLVLENLGNPTGTPYNYVYTELTELNDAGEGAGYAVVATSQPPYLPVRYTDGPVWWLFNDFPWTSASVTGLAASGDVTFQLGAAFGMFVYVNGFGSTSLQDTLAPPYADWDLTDTYALAMSRNGLVAATGSNSVTGESGVVLLSQLGFVNLGGASRGALGDPVLVGYGTGVAGDPTRVRLSSAAPNSSGKLIWSTTSNPIPKFGGTLYANPQRKATRFETDALGRWETTLRWPNRPSGRPIYFQAVVDDPEAEHGRTLSNALEGATQ